MKEENEETHLFKSQHCFEHIDKLAYEIGPREAGSKGDQKTADYIKNQFEDYGIQARFQHFKFTNKITQVKTTVLFLGLAFILTYFLDPLFSLAAVVAGLSLAYSLPKIMPKNSKSQNVIGTLEASEEVERRLVLSAHYDSAPCTKGRNWTLALRILLPLSSILLLLLSLTRFFDLIPIWSLVWTFLALLVIPTCILPSYVYEEFVTPGANDNATGVGIVLELARAFSGNPLKNTEVWFVAFGAEEQGLIGSKKFTQRSAPPDTLINLDTLGTGEKLSIIQGNGVFRQRRTSPNLNNQILSIAQDLDLELDSVWAPLSGHDHVSFSGLSSEFTTLSSIEDLGKNKFDEFLETVFRLPRVRTNRHADLHSLEDVPEKIKLSNIEDTGKLIHRVINNYEK